MSTFDAVISSSSRTFLQSLSISERIEFFWALDDLLRDPYPDGVSKVALDFYPYSPETFGASIGEFWMSYTFLNTATISIAGVYWNPDSPRRGGELYEA